VIGRAAALAGAAWAVPAAAPVVPAVARALRIPSRLAGSGTVALTFDDGPHPLGTPAVLDALAAAGARATFFLVGEQVRRTGTLAAEIAAAGHAVAVHGDRHRNLLRLTPGGTAADLDRAADTIAAATGAASDLHRAPYGIYSWPALAAIRRRGWTPVLWSAWGRDWVRGATEATVAAHVARDLGDGGIVLLHDADDYSVPGAWRATAAALPRILDAIAARGLRSALLDAGALRQGR
jgi:peptidoglycan/xylan/chitin deacetylase (PgdA/CDA1 family)